VRSIFRTRCLFLTQFSQLMTSYHQPQRKTQY